MGRKRAPPVLSTEAIADRTAERMPSSQPRHRDEGLSDALRALMLLRRGQWTVGRLCTALGLERRTVYRMLAALDRAGVALERQREGREVYYHVTREALAVLLGE